MPNVTVHLSDKTISKLKKMASAESRSFPWMMHAILTEVAAEAPDMPETHPIAIDEDHVTCLHLFVERGFTIEQIAFVLRLPVKTVAKEIGDAVDMRWWPDVKQRA